MGHHKQRALAFAVTVPQHEDSAPPPPPNGAKVFLLGSQPTKWRFSTPKKTHQERNRSLHGGWLVELRKSGGPSNSRAKGLEASSCMRHATGHWGKMQKMQISLPLFSRLTPGGRPAMSWLLHPCGSSARPGATAAALEARPVPKPPHIKTRMARGTVSHPKHAVAANKQRQLPLTLTPY